MCVATSCGAPWGEGCVVTVELTAARRLLAQLQPVDGQPIGSSAQFALVSSAFHLAFAIGSVGRLDSVAAVALGPELHTGVHVASGGEKGKTKLFKFEISHIRPAKLQSKAFLAGPEFSMNSVVGTVLSERCGYFSRKEEQIMVLLSVVNVFPALSA